MKYTHALLRVGLLHCLGLTVWLATEGTANAQLIAQTGMAKSAIGWVLVLLALILGLLVVCRPSGRKLAPGDEKKK